MATTLARRRVDIDPRGSARYVQQPSADGGVTPPHLPTAKAATAHAGLNPSMWGFRAHRSPIETDHQTRTSRATPRSLPGRERRPTPRPPTRRALPTAHGRTRPQPHFSQHCCRPQTCMSGLGHRHHRPTLRTPRPRRQPAQPHRRRRPRSRVRRPRRRSLTHPRTHTPRTTQPDLTQTQTTSARPPQRRTPAPINAPTHREHKPLDNR